MKKKLLILLLFFVSISRAYAIEDDDVALINGTYYKSITFAIEAATSSDYEITLIKDTSEFVTVPNGKKIVLDLNGYTLSNTLNNVNVIDNYGDLEIKNGTITSNAKAGAINNNGGANLVINSGSYIATGSRQALYNKGGTATIGGTSYFEAATAERAAVHNLSNGTLNITGGTILSKGAYAVYNDKGVINIGVKNDVYDKTSPDIQGKTYGVIANDKVNIYDGTIKGGTYHFGKANSSNTPTISNDNGETKINDFEQYSEKVLGQEDIGGKTYNTLTYNLDNSNRVKVTFDPNGGNVSKEYIMIFIGDPIGTMPNPTRMDHTFDGWFTEADGGILVTSDATPSSDTVLYAHWTYMDPNTVAYVEGIGLMSLEDAFATGGNIRLEKDVIIPTSLFVNKDVNLDLNGHTIDLGNNQIIINEDVVIDDSSLGKTGKITSKAPFTIVVGDETNPTNGKLTHKGGTIEGLGKYGAVINYGTLIIDGGNIYGSATENGFTVYNANELIMKSGLVHSANGRAIQVYTNATFTMDGGLVKTDATHDQALNLYGDCSAVINGGTIEGLQEDSAAIAMFGNTNLTVNGGIIKGSGMGISGNGNEVSGNANIVVNGGDIWATSGVGMYLPQRNSTTIINGGNISGPTGIEIRAGNLIVNDGNITGTSDIYEIVPNASGTTSKGAAIAVSQHNTQQPIEVIINNGNFKAPVALSEINPMNNPPDVIDQVIVNVYMGNFESTGNKTIDNGDDFPIVPFVTGGIFTTDPSIYVKDGYEVIKLSDNKYEVTKVHKVTIKSNIDDAVSTDKNSYLHNEKVTINVKEVAGYEVTIEVKDASGNKISVNNSTFIMPDNDVIINVKYKKIKNPKTNDSIGIYILLLSGSILGLIWSLITHIRKEISR